MPARSKLILIAALASTAALLASPAAAAFCTRRYAEREEGLYHTRLRLLNEVQWRMDAMRGNAGVIRRVSDDQAARFRTVADGMLMRFQAAQERERQLCARLDRKIIDRQTGRQEVGPAKTALIAGERQWLATAHLLEELKIKVGYVPDSDDPTLLFREVKAIAERAKESLQKTNGAFLEAAEALQKIIKSAEAGVKQP